MLEEGAWSHPSFPEIRRIVGERVGLGLGRLEVDDVETAVRRALRRRGLQQPESLLEDLRRGCPLALEALAEEFTVRETHFFRDEAQLDWLRAHILPRLFEERGPEHGLRVWSAGCSSGEEAYTLAIILEDAGRLQAARVVGTDISREALERARQGVYRPWSMRGVCPALQARFFQAQDDTLAIAPHLREAVQFCVLNLVDGEYPSLLFGLWDMDLILCRNVFIYFRPDTIRSVASRMHQTLAEGGWLILGPSDPILPDDLPFEAITTPAGTFYRRRRAIEIVPAAAPMRDQAHRESPDPLQARQRVFDEALMDLRPPARPAPSDAARIAHARRAFQAGDYQHAVEMTQGLDRSEEESLRELRALANRMPAAQVEPLAARAVIAHPLSVNLHYLHALILMEMGEDARALESLQRVVYLDRTLAMAWFHMGSLHARAQDATAARRAWRNAREFSGRLPRDSALPLAPEETAGALHDAASERLTRLEGQGVEKPRARQQGL